MAFGDLPLLKGWRYRSFPYGNPAQLPPYLLTPQQPLILVPRGQVGWFLNAIVSLNSAYAQVNLIIDEIRTLVTPHSLDASGQSGFSAGVFTEAQVQAMLTEAPEYGPISTMVYDVSESPIPFRDNVEVYMTSSRDVYVIGAIINVAVIEDQAAFAKSYQQLVGATPGFEPSVAEVASPPTDGE